MERPQTYTLMGREKMPDWTGTQKPDPEMNAYIDEPDLRIIGRRKQVESLPIKFMAEVAKVQTMADGGVRVVLDLGEDGRKIMEPLTECKQNGVCLSIEATKTG